MILNIRGTSGSGKSTLVRAIMDCYASRMRIREEGRKQPIGYLCTRPLGKTLAVPGHYETACGGCDTISSTDKIFELVHKSAKSGFDVVFEGLLISADVNRVAALHERWPEVHVLALSTPLEQCLADINVRRRTKKPDATDVNPDNTVSKFKGVQRSIDRLRALGVTCHVVDRSEGLALAKKLLRL